VERTETPWMRVIGVVPDIRLRFPFLSGEDHPVVYAPYNLQMPRAIGVLVRSPIDPAALAAMLRQVVQRADPDLPLFSVMTLQSVIDARTVVWRLISVVLVSLGGVALFLSCVGIYSVMAFAVGSRRQEIGIRMALGAPSGGILRLIVRGAIVQTILGAAVGLLAAVWATRVLEAFMYEISPTDPVTLTAALVLVVLTAIVASIVPARRASRADPLVALKPE